MKKHMYTYHYFRYRSIERDNKTAQYLFEGIICASIVFCLCVLLS